MSLSRAVVSMAIIFGSVSAFAFEVHWNCQCFENEHSIGPTIPALVIVDDLMSLKEAESRALGSCSMGEEITHSRVRSTLARCIQVYK